MNNFVNGIHPIFEAILFLLTPILLPVLLLASLMFAIITVTCENVSRGYKGGY